MVAFFKVYVPVKELLYGFFGTQQFHKGFLINAPILTVNIEVMMWDPKYIEGQMKMNMMVCFIECTDDLEDLKAGQRQDNYHVTIKKPLQFSLEIYYLRVELSFR